METNKESIKKNIVLNISATIAIGLLAFLVNRVFNDQLGQEQLGFLRLITQMLAYLSLAELGLGGAATALLFSSVNKNDIEKTSTVFNSTSQLYNNISVLILLVGISSNILLPYLIEEPSLTIHFIWSLYVVNVSISYRYAKYTILYTALNRVGYVQNVRNIIKISTIILQIVSLIVLKSFLVFVFLLIISTCLEFYIFRRFYEKNLNDYIFSTKERSLDLIAKTKQLFVHKIASVLVFNTDYIVIVKFIGLKEIAIYSSYLLITRFIDTIYSSIFLVIKPQIAKFYHGNDQASNREVVSIIISVNSFFSSLISVAMFLYIVDFVSIWMGEEYSLSITSVLLICLNFFVSMFRRPIDLIKDVAGYFKDINLPVLEGILNLSLSIILVHNLGLNGVLIGTLISNSLVIVLLKPYVVYRDVLGNGYGEYLIKTIKIFVLMFVLGYVCYILKNRIEPTFASFLLVNMIVFICNIFLYAIFDKDFRVSASRYFNDFWISKK